MNHMIPTPHEHDQHFGDDQKDRCIVCGKEDHKDNFSENQKGEPICEYCCSKDFDYIYCEDCDKYYHIDKLTRRSDDGYCPVCDLLIEPLN